MQARPSSRSTSWRVRLLRAPRQLTGGSGASRSARPSPTPRRIREIPNPPVLLRRAVLSGRLRAPQDNAGLPGSQVTNLDFFEAYSTR